MAVKARSPFWVVRDKCTDSVVGFKQVYNVDPATGLCDSMILGDLPMLVTDADVAAGAGLAGPVANGVAAFSGVTLEDGSVPATLADLALYINELCKNVNAETYATDPCGC